MARRGGGRGQGNRGRRSGRAGRSSRGGSSGGSSGGCSKGGSGGSRGSSRGRAAAGRARAKARAKAKSNAQSKAKSNAQSKTKSRSYNPKTRRGQAQAKRNRIKSAFSKANAPGANKARGMTAQQAHKAGFRGISAFGGAYSGGNINAKPSSLSIGQRAKNFLNSFTAKGLGTDPTSFSSLGPMPSVTRTGIEGDTPFGRVADAIKGFYSRPPAFSKQMDRFSSWSSQTRDRLNRIPGIGAFVNTDAERAAIRAANNQFGLTRGLQATTDALGAAFNAPIRGIGALTNTDPRAVVLV